MEDDALDYILPPLGPPTSVLSTGRCRITSHRRTAAVTPRTHGVSAAKIQLLSA